MEFMIQRIINELEEQNKSQTDLANFLDITSNVITDWKSGRLKSYKRYLHAIADFLGVSVEYLKGETDIKKKMPPLDITENYTEFPVIGEVAAGFDFPASEEWDGETVKIPDEYLKGRKKDEFFVLRVKGDSMSPLYLSGDKVLVLKQSTLNYSGQIGVVVYDGEYGTLKKVEYVIGEDWMRMVPINDTYRPVLIEGADLEQCRILGIPKLLIREIKE